MKLVKWIIVLSLVVGTAWWLIASNQSSDRAFSVEMIDVPESDAIAFAKGKVNVDGGVIEVAARLGGTFRDVLVKEGDRVEKGQILAVQEDDEEQISLRSVTASLESAKANEQQLMLRKEIAQREYDRLKPLVEIEASSQVDLDRALDDLRGIEVDMISQKAAILQAEASLESAKFRLEQRTVRAPVAGRIIEAKARPGVGASTLQVSTAFTLMPDTQKIVRADLDESFVGLVKLGQTVQISPDADKEITYPGKVIRVGEIFGRRTTQDESSRSGGSDHVIEVVVAAGDLPLLIGQRVMVKFLKTERAELTLAKGRGNNQDDNQLLDLTSQGNSDEE